MAASLLLRCGDAALAEANQRLGPGWFGSLAAAGLEGFQADPSRAATALQALLDAPLHPQPLVAAAIGPVSVQIYPRLEAILTAAGPPLPHPRARDVVRVSGPGHRSGQPPGPSAPSREAARWSLTTRSRSGALAWIPESAGDASLACLAYAAAGAVGRVAAATATEVPPSLASALGRAGGAPRFSGLEVYFADGEEGPVPVSPAQPRPPVGPLVAVTGKGPE